MKLKSESAITLIALIITIVVMLILASITIGIAFSDKGIIYKAKESAFKKDLREYQELVVSNKAENETMSLNRSTDIDTLRITLQKQIKSLSDGSKNIQEAIKLLQTAEESVSEIHSMLQRMLELSIQANMTEETDITLVQSEAEQLIEEINRLSNDTEYNGVKLLNGIYDIDNPYVVELGNGDFDQGKVEIVIPSVNWKNLYGSEGIDIKNLGKLQNIVNSVTQIRSDLGANQNRLDHTINNFNVTAENIESTYSYIFHSNENGGLATDSEAIQKAESWGTTIGFVQVSEGSLSVIHDMLQRMNQLAAMATNSTNDIKDLGYMQDEMDELISEIDRILKYTTIGNKRMFDGTFPYIKEMTVENLNIKDISIVSVEKAENALSIIQGTIAEISNIRGNLENIQNSLEYVESKKADKGYAFEITETITLSGDLAEKYKGKLTVINGEVTYIGNNAKERQWAIDSGIKVK